jgi:hypothetical protein
MGGMYSRCTVDGGIEGGAPTNKHLHVGPLTPHTTPPLEVRSSNARCARAFVTNTDEAVATRNAGVLFAHLSSWTAEDTSLIGPFCVRSERVRLPYHKDSGCVLGSFLEYQAALVLSSTSAAQWLFGRLRSEPCQGHPLALIPPIDTILSLGTPEHTNLPQLDRRCSPVSVVCAARSSAACLWTSAVSSGAEMPTWTRCWTRARTRCTKSTRPGTILKQVLQTPATRLGQ